jgi:hypothetical protein
VKAAVRIADRGRRVVAATVVREEIVVRVVIAAVGRVAIVDADQAAIAGPKARPKSRSKS